MDPALWLTFAGASLVLAVAPGPDNLFVLAQSAVYGVRAGLTVVLGLCTGLVVQTICAACGVAAVVAAVPALFWGIRIAGACYLIYLAWMAWTHAVSDSEGPQGTALTGMALWRRGVIMNITNPKVQIFFLAFFPQFVKPGTEGLDLIIQMIIQGVTFIGATLIVFSAVAWGAGALADRMRSPRFQLWLNRTSAVIFLMLAVFTVLS
ncbi:MAG: LysE family translocator [Sutterella sp.]|nr:LysE family translocator [Sutterella sp.]